jgi:alpha-tubulin suppressor-like RCC1 family protein
VRNDAGFISLRTGWQHSCARKPDGTIWCWGRNSWGQLGDGTGVNSSIPVRVSNVSDATKLAMPGDDYSCAIRAGNRVWCWGRNDNGRLGDGTNEDRTVPVQVIGLGAVVHLARGGHGASNMAWTTDREIWAWGRNNLGSLGLGDDGRTDYQTPRRVIGF